VAANTSSTALWTTQHNAAKVLVDVDARNAGILTARNTFLANKATNAAVYKSTLAATASFYKGLLAACPR